MLDEIVEILANQGYKQPTTISEMIENNDALFKAVVQVLDSHLIK